MHYATVMELTATNDEKRIRTWGCFMGSVVDNVGRNPSDVHSSLIRLVPPSLTLRQLNKLVREDFCQRTGIPDLTHCEHFASFVLQSLSQRRFLYQVSTSGVRTFPQFSIITYYLFDIHGMTCCFSDVGRLGACLLPVPRELAILDACPAPFQMGKSSLARWDGKSDLGGPGEYLGIYPSGGRWKHCGSTWRRMRSD
ncbi:uncharacterized protein EI90DRAFT_3044183 [Cantharellus anzutake]|uniref:uncharacterized protein n=1 Tax=Cantharellus anzutake TaxID=1750568 RepID=UPI0019048F3A|nr:uncharacterized protein EI90DRAFT_3044183 [Cantharellus anzutake]KAF8336922.1 hypothetical protein EI90DRAFT_3044183 [Cantharellus anzutake]